MFTLGGRLGFLASPSVLVYGLLGWTHADVNISGAYSTNIGGSTPIAFSQEDALEAVTVGAGIETLLGPGFSLKFEYRYTDLGDLSIGSSLATLAGVTSDGTSAVDVNTDIHAVRVVLTWRPGM
jgi:outer membrane immunogenic protein